MSAGAHACSRLRGTCILMSAGAHACSRLSTAASEQCQLLTSVCVCVGGGGLMVLALMILPLDLLC